LGHYLGVVITAGLAEDGRPQQRVQVTFVGLGFPANLLSRRGKEFEGKLLVRTVYRLVGDELFNVP